MTALASPPSMSRIPSTASAISTMPVQPHNKEASDRRRARAASNASKPLDAFVEQTHKHTWIIPGAITALVLLLWVAFNPYDGANPFRPFVLLSYRIVNSGGDVCYGKGAKDLMFCAFYTAFFTFLRESSMEMVLQPLAQKTGLTKAKQGRFMEQCYDILHFGFSGVFGVYVMAQTPMWPFDTRQFYVNYPHFTHSAIFKAFYLLQAANWAHLLVVLSLQLEKPRKDFFELTIHHITTLSLIFLSYRFHFTWIGVPVFWTHDISDVLLSFCKILNYLDAPDPIVPASFAIFTSSWIFTRHYLGIKILKSVATDFRTVGLWVLDWDKQYYKCWISQYVTFGLLSIIQLLDLYWLFLILRIAARIISGGEQKDDREDDDEEQEEKEKKSVPVSNCLLTVRKQ